MSDIRIGNSKIVFSSFLIFDFAEINYSNTPVASNVCESMEATV